MTDTQANKKSTKLIWMALAVTLALVSWTAFQEKTASVEALEVADFSDTYNQASKKREQGNKTSVNASTQKNKLIDWDKLDRTNGTDKSSTLFREHTWVVEPPKPKVVNTPPPPPVAPPVPFSYMGRLDNSPKGNLIYLATNDRSYSVVVGNEVDNFWKLDKEDAGYLYFTYLPLNLPQVLDKNQNLANAETALAPTSDFVNAFQQ